MSSPEPAPLFSARAERMLVGVHPHLVKVVRLARERSAFTVTEGLRTMERQRQLLAAGATKVLHSRHLTGHAVDVAALVNGKVRWDWPLYPLIAKEVKSAASALGIAIVWGGDWNGNGEWEDESFRDGPHFELSRRIYPAA